MSVTPALQDGDEWILGTHWPARLPSELQVQWDTMSPSGTCIMYTHRELGTMAYIYNPSALGKLRQMAHHEFEASMDYRLRSYLKTVTLKNPRQAHYWSLTGKWATADRSSGTQSLTTGSRCWIPSGYTLGNAEFGCSSDVSPRLSVICSSTFQINAFIPWLVCKTSCLWLWMVCHHIQNSYPIQHCLLHPRSTPVP